jgi:hypothetical protein
MYMNTYTKLKCDIPRAPLARLTRPAIPVIFSLSSLRTSAQPSAPHPVFVLCSHPRLSRSETILKSTTMPSHLLNTLAASLQHLLLLPTSCCGFSKSNPTDLRSRVKRNGTSSQPIIYAQYERRLYLKPVMPPRTRRRSQQESVSQPGPQPPAMRASSEQEDGRSVPEPAAADQAAKHSPAGFVSSSSAA